MKLLLLLLLLLTFPLSAHYLYTAQLYECNDSIDKWIPTYSYFIKAIDKTKEKIIDTQFFRFDDSAFTACFILQDRGHAAIHTYPEHRALFVDFFSETYYGWMLFEDTLVKLLEPKKITRKIYERDL